MKIGFFGGSGREIAFDMAVDKVNGTVYIVGKTYSSDFPTQFSDFTNLTSPNWFVAAFASQFGTSVFFFSYSQALRIFSTLLGGSDAELDIHCALYYPISNQETSILIVGGNTYSSDMPLQGPLSTFTQHEQFYLAAYNTSGFFDI